MNQQKTQTEILIVGGGMVGMSLAAATASGGIATTLVEAEPLPALDQPLFDGRSSAIAYGSQQVMAGIDAWQYIEAEASPILDIRVSDGGWQVGGESPFFVHYSNRDLPPGSIDKPGAAKTRGVIEKRGDQPPFGWIVENRAIRRGLLKRLAGCPHLTHLAPATVTDIRFAHGGATAQLNDGGEIRARLVIAADGRHSTIRRAAGIGFRELDYHQTAIVCTVAHMKPHHGVAHEHFLPVGPFAMLPMTDDVDAKGAARHRSSIVWTEDPRLVPMLLALSDDDLAAEIRQRFGDTLGDLRPIGPRFSYPLKLLLADAYVKDGLALVGDAAHAIHPIAGQGFNLGVRDVAALAEILVDAHRLGLDLGSLSVLDNYARWRRFDNLLLAGVTDGLTRLFSTDLPPVRLARDLGFFLFNKTKPLKRLAMRHAMGVIGDLPRLVRGLPL